MFFILIMRIMQWWYDRIFFPTISNPYTYGLVGLWMLIVGAMTYAFFYTIAHDRKRLMDYRLGLAAVKAAGSSLLSATIVIALYNMVLDLVVTSDSFKYQRETLAQFAIHISSQAVGFGIVEQRIMTILFLLFGLFFSMYFVSACSYYLQDDKNWKVYLGLVFMSSVVCYGICMVFGYV